MILFSLNPITWVKDSLVSDYVGGLVRHALTALGGYLIDHALVSQPFVDLLTSPTFIGGLISILTALIASVTNKTAV